MTTMKDQTRAAASGGAVGVLRRHWPILAGIALAVLTGTDLASGTDLAPVLAASGLIYLGAAALRTQAAAWPLFFGTFVVLAATKVVPGLPDPTWILLGAAVLFLVYGLLRGAARPAYGLPMHATAMAVVATAAAVAVTVAGDVGDYLVAAGLLGHAAWDVYHYRVDRVVRRSLAQFCFVLDTLLAVVIVVVALRG
jgi:hypothetical protein